MKLSSNVLTYPYCQKVIVDTGPLLEFLLLCFAEYIHKAWPKNSLRYAKGSPQQENLKQYFSRFQKIFTTAGVISEIDAHIRHSIIKNPYNIQSFWNMTIDFFYTKNISEEIIHLIKQSKELEGDFGPVDVSIIDLAKREFEREPKIPVTVFTIENLVYSQCTAYDYPIKHLLLDESGNITSDDT